MIANGPGLGPIAWAAVRIPPGRARAWQELTGWQAARGLLDDRLAAQLGAPQAAGLPLTVLTPASGAGGFFLIEAEGEVPPLRSLGWAAAELSVADLDGTARRAEALGFRALGAPRVLGSGASIRACQLADPGGAVLYCADVRDYGGSASLHRATAPVDRIFIAVLASADLEATRRWYAGRFALVPTSDHAVPIPILTGAWGFAPGSLWRISSQQLAGDCLLEIDQYPVEAGLRPCDASGLPGGVIAVAFAAARNDVLIGAAGERVLLVSGAR